MIFREVSARLFPWDYIDEGNGDQNKGIEQILDHLERDTLANSLYPVVLMHDEKRPLSEFYYPHNPRRKVYWTEDSRAYWLFDPDFYKHSRIKPLFSDNEELKGTDWLQFSIDAARRRGFIAGVELSHTWVDKARARSEFDDCRQRDVYGNPVGVQLCVNHPDVQEYARAMFADIATRYDLDFIQTCYYGFAGMPSYREKMSEMQRLVRLPAGACFCESCRQEAEKQGLNWNAIVERMRWIADGHDRYKARQAFDLNLLLNSSTTVTALMIEIPELYQWVKFRCNSYINFWKIIHGTAHAARPNIDIRFNDCWVYPDLFGFDLKGMSPYFDSIRAADYLEELGDPELMRVKRGFYHSIRRAVGLDKHFVTAISQRVRCTPELVKETILMSAQCGADGTTIASYDTATPALMRAVREGFEEAGIAVVPPRR